MDVADRGVSFVMWVHYLLKYYGGYSVFVLHIWCTKAAIHVSCCHAFQVGFPRNLAMINSM